MNSAPVVIVWLTIWTTAPLRLIVVSPKIASMMTPMWETEE